MDRLVSVLSRFSLSDIRKIEERDRQFQALKRLYSKLNDKELFFRLVLINALLSYQLQMKGEDYWEAFSDFFSEKPSVLYFREFLAKFNKRFLSSKLKRLERATGCVNGIFRRYALSDFAADLKVLVKELAKCMGQKETSKTIVFSAKMFLYAYRIAFGREPQGLEGIDVPLDSRLKKLFSDLKVWREISARLNVPPVHLDALVWVPMGMKAEELNAFPEELRRKILELKGVIDEKVGSGNGLRRKKGE